ncbi:MAG: response regulator transcription factor [Polyangiaceae bacterium]|nr:response regulator transcription factor [Polyangiaceae bacterium]
MPRILVAIADWPEAQQLQEHLQAGGHTVKWVPSASAALSTLRDATFDLIVLDSQLPDSSPKEFLLGMAQRTLHSDPPVILVSNSTDEVDRILGFELGASDYVTRPYSVRELTLRVAAVCRRARPEPSTERRITVGRLQIDREGYRAFVDDREVDLTLLELKLLIALYEGRHRVKTRAALLNEVWGVDAAVTTRTVDTHVKRLRDKLGPIGRSIETVRGVGYRLANLDPRPSLERRNNKRSAAI